MSTLFNQLYFVFICCVSFSISCQSRGNSISSEFLLWSVAMMLFDRIGFVSFQLLCMLFDHFCVSFSWSVTQCPHLQSLLDILSVDLNQQSVVCIIRLFVRVNSIVFVYFSKRKVWKFFVAVFFLSCLTVNLLSRKGIRPALKSSSFNPVWQACFTFVSMHVLALDQAPQLGRKLTNVKTGAAEPGDMPFMSPIPFSSPSLFSLLLAGGVLAQETFLVSRPRRLREAKRAMGTREIQVS